MSKPSKTSCKKSYNLFTFKLGYIIKVTILLLSVSSKCSLACYTGTGYYGLDSKKIIAAIPSSAERSRENLTGIKNHADRNYKVAFGSWSSWTPGPNVKKEWQEWLTNWEIKHNNTDLINPADKNQLKKDRQGSGYPTDWLDLGEGLAGVPPPPWSYVIKKKGTLEVCALPPRRGNCTDKLVRWAYNSFVEQCVQFEFSGCNGNRNNFSTKYYCERHCVYFQSAGCDNNMHIYPEDIR